MADLKAFVETKLLSKSDKALENIGQDEPKPLGDHAVGSRRILNVCIALLYFLLILLFVSCYPLIVHLLVLPSFLNYLNGHVNLITMVHVYVINNYLYYYYYY